MIFWIFLAMPHFGQNRPILAKIGRFWPKIGQFWPKLVDFGPKIDQFWPKFADFKPKIVIFWPIFTEFGQIRPIFALFNPKIGQTRPRFGQFGSFPDGRLDMVILIHKMKIRFYLSKKCDKINLEICIPT